MKYASSAPVPPRKVLSFFIKNALFVFLTAAVMLAGSACRTDCADATPPGFVHLAEAVPDAILEVRYYSTYNFIGDRVRGYERPTPMLTVEAAKALKAVSDELLPMGYRLKVYDSYRPQRAVNHFVEWAKRTDDTRMKAYFYPDLDKSVLFPQGYIAEKSGHSRGSTVDLTLFDMKTGKEVDMGGTFDWFGLESHPDWGGDPETKEYTGSFPAGTPDSRKISAAQFRNRMLLRSVMLKHGFKPVDTEWWHFTLENEPYPDTYFDYPVSYHFTSRNGVKWGFPPNQNNERSITTQNFYRTVVQKKLFFSSLSLDKTITKAYFMVSKNRIRRFLSVNKRTLS